MKNNLVEFRKPIINDADVIWHLVDKCKPLDLNSKYLYLLLCSHFRDTCNLAEKNGKIIGFCSSYIPPTKENTLFVWQIAVDEENRQSGIAKKMIEQIISRHTCKNVKFIEATVTPSNKKSMSFFASLAGSFGTELTQSEMFAREQFGSTEHEDENLVHIGPIKKGVPVEVGMY